VKRVIRKPLSIEIAVEPALLRYIVPKGSVAVNGASLTVGPSVGNARFTVFIIPRTWEHTNLRDLKAGGTVNISPAGILAECAPPGACAEGQAVEVRIGLPPETWPEQNESFRACVRRVEENRPARLAIEVVGQGPLSLSIPELVGFHPSILELKRQLLKVRDYDVNVLLEGESGTGKNVVAGAIHRYSRRWKAPFIRVNCPSIP
jgi:hypothetical protein